MYFGLQSINVQCFIFPQSLKLISRKKGGGEIVLQTFFRFYYSYDKEN